MVDKEALREIARDPRGALEREIGLPRDVQWQWMKDALVIAMCALSVVAFAFCIAYTVMSGQHGWPLIVVISMMFFAVFPLLVLYTAIGDESLTTRDLSPAIVSIGLGVVLNGYTAEEVGFWMLIVLGVLAAISYFLFETDLVLFQSKTKQQEAAPLDAVVQKRKVEGNVGSVNTEETATTEQ